jgi:REP element-mobilizing transposase RayT
VPHPFALFAKGWAGSSTTHAARPQMKLPRRIKVKFFTFQNFPVAIPTFMTTGLHRYYGSEDMHFITCSCFQRRPLLGDPALRTLFLKILEEVRQSYQFVVAAFVVMPEHFHLLVTEPERDDLSQVMQVLKQRVSRRALSVLRRSGTPEEEHFGSAAFMISTCGAQPSTPRRCITFTKTRCSVGW